MHRYRDCILYERVCVECGECDRCDLDNDKLCDNCNQCMMTEGVDFRAIRIDGLLTKEESLEEE